MDSGRLRVGSGCTGMASCLFEPFHFSSKFHPKYADPEALKKLMAERGNITWVQLWNSKYAVRYDANVPVLSAFYTCDGGNDDSQRLCANPYFHGVDPAGQQLPYMDGWTWYHMANRDIAVFRAMSGETDGPYTDGFIVQELPLYIANMDKGDYSIGQWPDTSGNDAGLQINPEYNIDTEIGRWIRTKEFRQAMSLSLDRNQMNEVAFLGIGTPQAWVPHPASAYYPGDDLQQYDAVRDVTKAKQLLANLGLVDTDGNGYVNRVDGKGDLELFFEYREAFAPVIMMMQSNFKDIGLKMTIKEVATGTLAFHRGELYFNMRNMALMTNMWFWTQFLPYRPVGLMIEMGRYDETNGVEGMAPVGMPPVRCPGCSANAYLPPAPAGRYPADPDGFLMQMQKLYREGKMYSMLDPKRIDIGKELYRINLRNNFHLGTVAYSGNPQGIVLKRNNLRNVPARHGLDYFSYDSFLWYFEDGADNMNHPGNRSKNYRSVSFLECSSMSSNRC